MTLEPTHEGQQLSQAILLEGKPARAPVIHYSDASTVLASRSDYVRVN